MPLAVARVRRECSEISFRVGTLLLTRLAPIATVSTVSPRGVELVRVQGAQPAKGLAEQCVLCLRPRLLIQRDEAAACRGLVVKDT